MRRISTDGKTFAVLEDGIAQAEQVIGDRLGRRRVLAEGDNDFGPQRTLARTNNKVA